MAAAVADLQSEVSCPVCLEYFTDPVTIECGHSYCRACITLSWDRGGGALACPQCRKECTKTDLAKNLHLANLVEIVQKFDTEPRDPRDVCERHKEKLKLFCEVDQKAVCVICHMSQEHRGHTMVPIEEASEKYKLECSKKLEALRKEMNTVARCKAIDQQTISEFKAKVKKERVRIEDEFNELHQFLEEEKGRFLSQLKEEEMKILHKLNEALLQYSEQSYSLKKQVTQVEEKLKLSSVQQLQDMKSVLTRCECKTFKKQEDISTELNASICAFSKEEVVSKMFEKYIGSPSPAMTNESEARLTSSKPGTEKINRSLEIATGPQESLTPRITDLPDVRSSRPQGEELRILLFDLTGDVKSAVANAILGIEEFDRTVTTRKCWKQSCERSGRRLVVTDVPIFEGEGYSEETLETNLMKCFVFSVPGPHAIILVLNTGRPFSEVEDGIKAIQELFDNEGERHTIVLFTGKENLRNKTIDRFLQESEVKLRNLIAKCGNRYCAFKSRAGRGEREQQVSELLALIDSMLHKCEGACYTSDLHASSDEFIVKMMACVTEPFLEERQRDERNIMHQCEDLLEDLKAGPESPEKTKLQEDVRREAQRKLRDLGQKYETKLEAAREALDYYMVQLVNDQTSTNEEAESAPDAPPINSKRKWWRFWQK
ncbi:uncharacterized protein [Ambystoma mexicanum]|uniref:uncharacterized protein n=1 Tax=Ambystoma mexicanum TaxID=8296 RepID=UPI0037E7E1DB